MAVFSSASDAMASDSRLVSAQLDGASARSPLGGSQRVLRWKPRETAREEMSSSMTLDLNGQTTAASHDVSRSTRLQHVQGEPIRSGSPSRRGESVRRRASLDLDSLMLSSDTSPYRTSTLLVEDIRSANDCSERVYPSVPLNKRDSADRKSEIYVPADATQHQAPHTGRTSRKLAAEQFQILRARRLLEFRSNSKIRADDSSLETSPLRNAVLTDNPLGTSHDIRTQVKDMVVHPTSTLQLGSSPHSSVGTRRIDWSRDSPSLQLTGGRPSSVRRSFGPGRQELHVCDSSSEIRHGTKHNFPERQQIPLRDEDDVCTDPSISRCSKLSENVAQDSPPDEHVQPKEDGQTGSSSPNIQLPVRQLKNGNTMRIGEGLSQSARFATDETAGAKSGLLQRPPALRSTKTNVRNHDSKGNAQAPSRTPGLSISCRRLSVDYDVLDNSGSNKDGSKGHKSSFPRQRSALLPFKESFSEEGPWRDQRAENVRAAESYHSTKSVGTRPKRGGPNPSPASSFKKWIACQLHFGTCTKNKLKLISLSSASASSCVKSGLVYPTEPQQNTSDSYSIASATQLAVVVDNKVPTLRSSDAKTRRGHPLPEPPEDFLEEHGSGSPLVLRSKSGTDSESQGFIDFQKAKLYEDRTKKRNPTRNARVSSCENEPFTFHVSQVLPADGTSLSDVHVPVEILPVENFDVSAKTMKFLECPEIAYLNEFLSAKRDICSLKRKSDRGYLKFITTNESPGLGTLVSAICYSYFLERRKNGSGKWSVVPLMNFRRSKMKDHVDAAWLFNVCGLDVRSLLFLNEVDFDRLSGSGLTVKKVIVGEQLVQLTDKVGSMCTLLAEMLLRDEVELWTHSGRFLKTLLLAGLLMDTDNLNKPSSRSATCRDHRIYLNLATGAGSLGRFGLYERMKTVHTDEEVMKMAKKHYGFSAENIGADSCGGHPATTTNVNSSPLFSSKGSPLFSSETEDNFRSSCSPHSRLSSSGRISDETNPV